MDTSKKRIKMCKEAVEIQRLWKPDLGDCVYAKYKFPGEKSKWYIAWFGDELFYHYSHGKDGVMRPSPYPTDNEDLDLDEAFEEIIWLPGQDQLQGMLKGDINSIVNDFFVWYLHEDTKPFTSMEQLWLAFVMKIKYGKIWNNEKGKWEVV